MTTIAHLSDPHLTTDPESTARFRRVLDLLPLLGPDVLLVSGDLADHGTAEEYAVFRDALPTGLPTVYCPGNHDDVPTYRRELLGTSDPGPTVSAVDVPGLRVVAIDSTIPGKPEGLLAEDVLAAADEALREADRAVLALHHPPIPIGHPVADTMMLTNPSALAALLDANPQVVACCTGHVHRPLVSGFAGRPLLGAPGVASGLHTDPAANPMTDPGAAAGFALHTVESGSPIRTEFHFAW